MPPTPSPIPSLPPIDFSDKSANDFRKIFDTGSVYIGSLGYNNQSSNLLPIAIGALALVIFLRR